MRRQWQDVLDAEIARVPFAELLAASQALTAGYRETRTAALPRLSSDASHAAYLAVRMPATYRAASSALEYLHHTAPLQPTSLLDLASGPGTASLAALELFPSLQHATLIERDPRFCAIARALLPSAHIETADVSAVSLPQADLVLVCYALNELSATARHALMRGAFHAATQAVVFIEPGSPAGFRHILDARQHAIDAPDWHIAAPCPGEMPCPLAQLGDWCHFGARLERNALHRRLKHAALSYEDEKFSYVAAVRTAPNRAPARIVRRPEKLTGHVKLTLCTPAGLQPTTVTRKLGDSYKQARKTEWGDPFVPLPSPTD